MRGFEAYVFNPNYLVAGLGRCFIYARRARFCIISLPMNTEIFHPAVASWFGKTFPAATAPQQLAWPSIKAHRDTLIAAPTGSGKTLAAFLAAIDDLVRLGVDGQLDDTTHVVYVSPLKALSNDIQRNLQIPLEGIQQELSALGLPDINIRTLVRTGDTPAAGAHGDGQAPAAHRCYYSRNRFTSC